MPPVGPDGPITCINGLSPMSLRDAGGFLLGGGHRGRWNGYAGVSVPASDPTHHRCFIKQKQLTSFKALSLCNGSVVARCCSMGSLVLVAAMTKRQLIGAS